MEKDPRDVLQSFEVDDNECILEYKPKNKKAKRMGPTQLSNTAILSLCLMTGLSAGVGSAYIGSVNAETKVEVPVEAPVVDEPITKPDVNVQQQLEPKVNQEVIPNLPPLDQPVSSGKSLEMHASGVKEEKQEKRERAEKKVQRQSQVMNHYSTGQAFAKHNEKNYNSPSTASVKQKGNVKSVKQKENVKTVHAAQSKHHSPDHDSSPRKPVSLHKPVKADQSQQTQFVTSPKLKPKTVQGGQLPVTAGNDLNGALLGGAAAALGALYYGMRRKAEQE